MKIATRVLALLMMLCLVVMCFAACKPDSGDESKTSKPTTDENVLFSDLPEKDFGGETVTILVLGEHAGTYKSTEITEKEGEPEVLNEAIKRRNELVEDTFGVVIEEAQTTATETMSILIERDVMGGTGDYDIVMPYIPDAARLSLESYFWELNELEHINLKNPCWDINGVESLSINNENYFATGDISLLSLACTHAIVFNKDMISTYNLESPYELVENGDWTIDKLREMASKVTADIDGQTGMSYKDRYGFLINKNFVTSMFIGSGMTLTGKNDSDIPYVSVIDEKQTAYSKFKKIFELVNDTKATGKIDYTSGGYYTSAITAKDSVWIAATESVANGLALFRAMSIIDIIDLGKEDCSFGIVPVPKFDKKQDRYYSNVSTILSSCLAIPTSAPNVEMSAIVAQAMCEASTDTTKEAYVEVILKGRKIQDFESEAMLDKIFSDRVYDLGIVYCWGGTGVDDPNSIGSFMNDIAMNGTETFSSTLETIGTKVQSDLASTLEDFYAIEDTK